MPRAKLLEAKPRGRMSAYAFFVQSCREEHKKKHPDENVVFADFSRKCADKWKEMDDKEKTRFYALADKDKTRYDTEMMSYTGPRTRSRKRRNRKDPNAPKRALSAFFWFSVDERPKVKITNPEYGAADTAKELGQRWGKCDKDTRERFEQMAAKDRLRYEKEMSAYKAGLSFNSNKKAKFESDEGNTLDDDDIEDDDDDDDDDRDDDDDQ